MFDKNVYKITLVCCNYAVASYLWSVTTVMTIDTMLVRLVISLEAESIKFRKLRVEEAPCRFVASLQNIFWFTTCKQ